MDRFIENPWLLRITALVLAILMFFSVKPDGNEVDSTSSGMKETVLEDVPVELRYDDTNFVVTGVPQTVDVKIEGPIGIVITTQTGKNYKVVVNIKDKPTGEYLMKFTPEGFSDKLDVQVSPKTVKVKVEERITKEVRVEPEINENQLAGGKYVKAMTTEPEVVTVSGAKSAIDSISYVKATVSAENGVSESFEKSAGVKIFDRDLNILNVDVEPKTVKVKVDIAEYNREVPVVVKQKGNPANGYEVESLTAKVGKVIIFGPSSAIDQIKEVELTTDVTGLKKTSTIEGKLQIPQGVTNVSVQTIDVRAIIKKEKATEKDDEEAETAAEDQQAEEENTTANVQQTVEGVTVRLSGLNIDELNSNFLTPETGQIAIDIEGNESEISNLSAADFTASVDASNVQEGTVDLPIQVNGPEGLTIKPSTESAKVEFSKKDSNNG